MFYFVSFNNDNVVDSKDDEKSGSAIKADTTAQISYRGTLWNIQVFDAHDPDEWRIIYPLVNHAFSGWARSDYWGRVGDGLRRLFGSGVDTATFPETNGSYEAHTGVEITKVP